MKADEEIKTYHLQVTTQKSVLWLEKNSQMPNFHYMYFNVGVSNLFNFLWSYIPINEKIFSMHNQYTYIC